VAGSAASRSRAPARRGRHREAVASVDGRGPCQAGLPPAPGLAVHLRRVSEVQAIRVAPEGPRPIKMALRQPACGIEHGLGAAQPSRDGHRGFSGQAHPRETAAVDSDRPGEREPSQGTAGRLIPPEASDRGMVDLPHGQWPRGWREGAGHRRALLTGSPGALPAPQRGVRPQRVAAAAHRRVRQRWQRGAVAAAPPRIDHPWGRAGRRGELGFLHGRLVDGRTGRRPPSFAWATGVGGWHPGAQGPSAGAGGSEPWG
jgi:hypothetical protein